ncbi:HTH-type transcriptional activator RhaR [[Enterobacter] lignolyticus]|uniref:HTH-type transcriptional activator RhaR n=1 Tax=[Enterobacter] lignolyticus TaxID=1334193 RepID=A0A806X880_9ENTR|nr:HTH-type transcriptional activator RhaR [[Enterobacter] lignolyticus]ALR74791.1 transcriptional regulator [[Enterobacter] lignolyticus]
MTGQLILRKADFFTSPRQAVAVADRYPQNVFAEHTHEFCELVLVWRGNGLHLLNDRPYRITRGDLFYIRAEDKHSYASVNGLALQNIIYCPDRLRLNVDWSAHIPGLFGTPWMPHWRIGSSGMAQARQVIALLEQESNKDEPLAHEMAELLFAQLAATLRRHRFATDNQAATQSEALLDKLITALAGSLNRTFTLDLFCAEQACSERALRQQFRSQTGMTVNHYLRQLRICHAQYLLQHSELLIGDIANRCGFEDSNYFSVVFNREVGMTPGQWRHRHRTTARSVRHAEADNIGGDNNHHTAKA